MNVILDLLLLGIMGIFRQKPETDQRILYKMKQRKIDERQDQEDTSLQYIILDDLGKHHNQHSSFQYEEPPTFNDNCDGDPEW